MDTVQLSLAKDRRLLKTGGEGGGWGDTAGKERMEANIFLLDNILEKWIHKKNRAKHREGNLMHIFYVPWWTMCRLGRRQYNNHLKHLFTLSNILPIIVERMPADFIERQSHHLVSRQAADCTRDVVVVARQSNWVVNERIMPASCHSHSHTENACVSGASSWINQRQYM